MSHSGRERATSPSTSREAPDSSAVLARTAVACARVASLTTYTRQPGGHHVTCTSVRPRTDGSVAVLLSPSSAAARRLLSRPIATVQVAPVGCEPVLLHGAARRLPGVSADGRLVFHVQAAAVRVGQPAVPVDEASYLAALPDPLRGEAPAVLVHLNEGRRDALTACVRARGVAAEFTHAVRLDAAGLTVLAFAACGVATLRLDFDHPVSSLAQLPAGLQALLMPPLPRR